MRKFFAELCRDNTTFAAVLWWESTRDVRTRALLVLVLIILAAVLTGASPVMLKVVVDGLLHDGHSPSVLPYVGVFAYVSMQWLSRSATELRGLIYARVERRMFRALSERVFGHLMRLPMRFHMERRTGAITQTLENGLQGYQAIMRQGVFNLIPVLVELITVSMVLASV